MKSYQTEPINAMGSNIQKINIDHLSRYCILFSCSNNLTASMTYPSEDLPTHEWYFVVVCLFFLNFDLTSLQTHRDRVQKWCVLLLFFFSFFKFFFLVVAFNFSLLVGVLLFSKWVMITFEQVYMNVI